MYILTTDMLDKYFDSDGKYLKEDLTTDEWLDFLIDYNKCNEKPLGAKDNYTLAFILSPTANYNFV